MGEQGGECRCDVAFGDGARSDVEKDLRFRLEARPRRVAAEECATMDSGRKVEREDCSVIGSRTCGTCTDFVGGTVSMLRRNETGTGEPDASIVILSHAGRSSLLGSVIVCNAFPQPASSQPFVALLSRFSWLVAHGASYMELWGDG